MRNKLFVIGLLILFIFSCKRTPPELPIDNNDTVNLNSKFVEYKGYGEVIQDNKDVIYCYKKHIHADILKAYNISDIAVISDKYYSCSAKDNSGILWFGGIGNLLKVSDAETKVYTVKDGLSNVEIKNIATDSKGNVWMVSYQESGLIKFSGSEFVNLNITTATGLIRDIAIDKNDNIWLASEKGVIKYDGENFINFEGQSNSPNSARAILVDNNNNIWADCYMYNGNVWTKYDLPGDIVDIIQTKNGSVWFANLSGRDDTFGIAQYDGINWKYYTANDSLKYNKVWSLFEDSKGKIWVSYF